MPLGIRISFSVEAATLRVFADGGANRVYDGMPRLFPEQDPLEVRRRFFFFFFSCLG